MPDVEPIGGVLLVDDESEFVDTVQERLMTRGIDAKIAYNGEEALNLVAQSCFRVVVLDLKMPGLNGLQVLEKLRTTHPDLQIIMLTGHGSVHERCGRKR
jgi:two-component system response regulator CpxR